MDLGLGKVVFLRKLALNNLEPKEFTQPILLKPGLDCPLKLTTSSNKHKATASVPGQKKLTLVAEGTSTLEPGGKWALAAHLRS